MPSFSDLFQPLRAQRLTVLRVLLGLALLPGLAAASAQTAPVPSPAGPPPPASPASETPAGEAAPPSGKVIFSTSQPAIQPEAESDSPATPAAPLPSGPPDAAPQAAVTNQERAAVGIVSSDLDVHLTPADARIETRATLLVRNLSAVPLARIPLQLSSSLRWVSISSSSSAAERPGLAAVPFTQSPLATEADHTGSAEEAVIVLAQPLAPAATVMLSVFYAGRIEAATAAGWDAITSTTDRASTSLRGPGNVIWYPVALPAIRRGESNELTGMLARERRRNLTASMRLHLTVDTLGDPPDSVIFNGRLQPLTRTPDTDTQTIDDTHGVATASFAAAPIGYRLPSLFLTAQHAMQSPDQLLTVITANPAAAEPYAAAAALIAPVLSGLLGPTPAESLLLLDHTGQTFEEGAFLATAFDPAARPEALTPALVTPLTHAWFQIPGAENTWLDQGLAEFAGLLWTEHAQGRKAALAALQHAAVVIALSEPDLSASEPLPQAVSEVLLRYKSASVLWQLRELLGDERFRLAMTAFRHSVGLNPHLAQDPHSFEHALEASSHQDLAWFFTDWVDRDRGLPDLAVLQVNPRPLPARPGKSSGYLVAVEVRNDGDAVADVPVTVRAAATSATERIRVPAHETRSVRILFEDTPETVEVNDGSVPEQRVSSHLVPVTVTPK